MSYILQHRHLLLASMLMAFTHFAYSQSIGANKFVYETSILGGINYNYTSLQEANKSLFHKGFFGVTVKAGKQTNGTQLWHKPFNNPVCGFGITYTQISKNRIVGNPLSLYSYINIPLKKLKNKVHFEMENGIAYFINDRKQFSSLTKNRVVGSRLNFHIGLDLSFAILLSKKYTTRLGLKVQHYSNGNVRTPNFGVNVIGISAGIKYEPKETLIEENQINLTEEKRINEYSLSPRFAFNTHRKSDKPNEYYVVLNLDYWRSVTSQPKVTPHSHPKIPPPLKIRGS